MASSSREYYGPAPTERSQQPGQTQPPKTSWPDIGEPIPAGHIQYPAANQASQPARPAPPTREEADAIFDKLRQRNDEPEFVLWPRESEPRQKMAETLQTWIAETTHAKPRGDAARELSNKEKNDNITERLMIKTLEDLRERTVAVDGSLMRERGEWHDWRLIAGTEYWECPRCKEFVHTDDVKLHKASHPVAMGPYPGL